MPTDQTDLVRFLKIILQTIHQARKQITRQGKEDIKTNKKERRALQERKE